LAQKAIALSYDLQPHESLFTLGEDMNLPHISLYMVQLDPENLSTATVLLNEIAVRLERYALTALSYNQTRGYIDVVYEKLLALRDLQISVVAAFTPLRVGTHDAYLRHLQAVSPEARANIEQYGYPNIGSLFRPHLTFTRLANNGAVSLENMPSPAVFSGSYERLGVFELGPHGTCVRQIASVGLL
jgi:hypothetical protein